MIVIGTSGTVPVFLLMCKFQNCHPANCDIIKKITTNFTDMFGVIVIHNIKVLILLGLTVKLKLRKSFRERIIVACPF